MNKKTLKTLEFDKILDMLKAYAVCNSTKENITKLVPSNNIKKVNIMQNETAEALMLITKKGQPPIYFSGDAKAPLKRAEIGGVLSSGELLLVAGLLKTARMFKAYPEEIHAETLYEHFEAMYCDKVLENDIVRCFPDENTVSDDASDGLFEVRKKLKGCSNKVRDVLQSFISGPKAKYLQEQIITVRGDRSVVPVKAEFRGEVKGIVHDTSATGATLFIEPVEAVEANNEIRELRIREKEEIEKVLMAFSQKIADISKLLDMTYETILELDLIFARAKFSLRYDAYRPVLNDMGYIDLEKARHPLLDEKKVVPTDITVGKNFDTLVVTGPNTGGKTVVLKTAGLLTLMAQSGLHITAQENSQIAVFDDIYADIGDEQSIEQSLSTFSAHMVNIVNILNSLNKNKNSLCLFDELGAGTDPIEGAALAVSILEKVRSLGAKTLATTHYSELKLYALSTKGVENASCEFDVNTLSPTYKLLIGVPGKSNAFLISSRLGLGDDIIENAKEHINEENLKFEDVLTELEASRRQMAEEKQKAELYRRETEKLKNDTANTNRLIREKTERIIERARMEAKEILEGAKDDADEIIKEIRDAQKLKDAKEASRLAEKARQKLNEKNKRNSEKIAENLFKVKEAYKAPKQVKLGDDVEIVKFGQVGTVCTLPDKNGELFVKVGIMKIKANIADLRLTGESLPKANSKKTPNHSSGASVTKTMSLSSELDVRGETVDTAVVLIDKFLDDAVLSSLGQVRIIHGKGTGMLRKGIHDYLRRLPYVKSYRLGVFGEGDAGVTVVELK